jgi:hypothetical protein
LLTEERRYIFQEITPEAVGGTYELTKAGNCWKSTEIRPLPILPIAMIKVLGMLNTPRQINLCTDTGPLKKVTATHGYSTKWRDVAVTTISHSDIIGMATLA